MALLIVAIALAIVGQSKTANTEALPQPSEPDLSSLMLKQATDTKQDANSEQQLTQANNSSSSEETAPDTAKAAQSASTDAAELKKNETLALASLVFGSGSVHNASRFRFASNSSSNSTDRMSGGRRRHHHGRGKSNRTVHVISNEQELLQLLASNKLHGEKVVIKEVDEVLFFGSLHENGKLRNIRRAAGN